MTKYLSAGAIVLSVSFFAFTYISNDHDTSDSNIELVSLENLVEIPPMPSVDDYGFVEDEIDEVIVGTVKRDESFYVLMSRHGLTPQEIYQVQQNLRGKANIDRFMPGQYYRIYKSDDSVNAFVWHQSKAQYSIIEWRDEIEYMEGSLPIEQKLSQSKGIINSSLYETLIGQGESQYLGSKLADIFAWEIDFFRLQKGDHFKTVHEELYIDDEQVGMGAIHGAEFQHEGDIYRAYYFDNGERFGYFDKDGNSLQKALLKAPFKYSQRVSSGFSQSRFHPILKERRPHHGTDYAARTGTAVIAVGDGVVTEAQRRGGNGNIVQIRHNGTYKTAYLHLNGFAPGIRKGTTVEQGQVIGYVGSTGLATGPHLCYRMYVNERPVNSRIVDLPASDGLEEEYMDEFSYIVKEMDEQLDSISLKDDESRLVTN